MKRATIAWKPAEVGCYWYSDVGDFTISTRITYVNGRAVMTWPDSGYVLTRRRNELGVFKTLEAAQRAAAAEVQ